MSYKNGIIISIADKSGAEKFSSGISLFLDIIFGPSLFSLESESPKIEISAPFHSIAVLIVFSLQWLMTPRYATQLRL